MDLSNIFPMGLHFAQMQAFLQQKEHERQEAVRDLLGPEACERMKSTNAREEAAGSTQLSVARVPFHPLPVPVASAPAPHPPVVSAPPARKQPAAVSKKKSTRGDPSSSSQSLLQMASSFGFGRFGALSFLPYETDSRRNGSRGGSLAGKLGDNKFFVQALGSRGARCDDHKRSSTAICSGRIEAGELAIGKVPPGLPGREAKATRWFHPACVFNSFRRVRGTTKTITSPTDLEGFHLLSSGQRQALLHLIDLHAGRGEEAGATAGESEQETTSSLMSLSSLLSAPTPPTAAKRPAPAAEIPSKCPSSSATIAAAAVAAAGAEPSAKRLKL